MPYTKAQFIEHFGGTGEWDTAPANASVDDHAWFQEKLAQEQELGEKTKARLQAEIEKLKKERESLRKENIQRMQEIEELEKEKRGLGRELKDAKWEIGELHGQIGRLEETLARTVEEWELKCLELKKEVSVAQEQTRAVEREMDRRAHEHAKEKLRMTEDYNKDISLLKESHEREKYEIIKEWEYKNQALRNEMEQLIKTHKAEVHELMSEHEREIERVMRENEKEKREIEDRWKTKCDDLEVYWQGRYNELEDKNRELEEEIRRLLKRLAKYEHHVAYGAINRMRNLGLSKAWEKWQQSYADDARQQRVLRGAIRRMRNRLLSMAWEKWQHEAGKMTKQRYMMQGALNRMRNFHLSRAWEKWQFEYEEQKRIEKSLKGALNRMRNFHLSRAWEQWQWYYHKVKQFDSGELADKLDAALKRIRELESDLDHQRALHAAERARMIQDHGEELEGMRREHDLEKRSIITEWTYKTRDLEEQLAAALRKLEEIERLKEMEIEQIRKMHEREKQAIVKEWEARTQDLRRDYEAALREIEELKREIERIKEEAEAKYAQLILQVEQITGEKVIVQDHLSVEQTATVKLKAEVDRLLQTIEELRARISELEMDDGSSRRLADLMRELEERERQIEALRREIAQIKDETARRFAELSREIERITGLKINVEGDLTSERDMTSNLRKDIDQLLRTIEDLKRMLEEGQADKDRVAQLESEIDRLRGVIRGLEGDSLQFHPEEWNEALSYHKSTTGLHDASSRHSPISPQRRSVSPDVLIVEKVEQSPTSPRRNQKQSYLRF
jgi:chromosome segregation ATPase